MIWFFESIEYTECKVRCVGLLIELIAQFSEILEKTLRS